LEPLSACHHPDRVANIGLFDAQRLSYEQVFLSVSNRNKESGGNLHLNTQ